MVAADGHRDGRVVDAQPGVVAKRGGRGRPQVEVTGHEDRAVGLARLDESKPIASAMYTVELRGRLRTWLGGLWEGGQTKTDLALLERRRPGPSGSARGPREAPRGLHARNLLILKSLRQPVGLGGVGLPLGGSRHELAHPSGQLGGSPASLCSGGAGDGRIERSPHRPGKDRSQRRGRLAGAERLTAGPQGHDLDLCRPLQRVLLEPVGERFVVLARLRRRRVVDHRLPVARRLPQHLVLADHHRQDLAGELTLQRGENRAGELRIGIVERRQQVAGDGAADVLDHPLDGRPLLLGAAPREEAGLDGDQRLPRRPQGIERQEPHRGRTVDQAAVVAVGHPPKQAPEAAVLVRKLV